jgi:hypothetical protein
MLVMAGLVTYLSIYIKFMNITVLLINLALINNYFKANPKYREIKQ